MSRRRMPRRRSTCMAPISRPGSRRTRRAGAVDERTQSVPPDKPIRGGVPICFPWFGPHAEDRTAPAHGFARLQPWTLCDARSSRLTARSALDAPARGRQRHRRSGRTYVSRRPHRRSGRRLTMTLDVDNPLDESPFTFEAALHTYFAVERHRAGQRRRAWSTRHYLDKVGGPTWRQQDDASDPVHGRRPTASISTRSAPCVIHDPRLVAPHHDVEGRIAVDGRLESVDRQGPRDARLRRRRVARDGVRRDRRTSAMRRYARPGDATTMQAEISVEPRRRSGAGRGMTAARRATSAMFLSAGRRPRAGRRWCRSRRPGSRLDEARARVHPAGARRRLDRGHAARGHRHSPLGQPAGHHPGQRSSPARSLPLLAAPASPLLLAATPVRLRGARSARWTWP